MYKPRRGDHSAWGSVCGVAQAEILLFNTQSSPPAGMPRTTSGGLTCTLLLGSPEESGGEAHRRHSQLYTDGTGRTAPSLP